MAQTLKLKNPIELGGRIRKVLEYDFEGVPLETIQNFLEDRVLPNALSGAAQATSGAITAIAASNAAWQISPISCIEMFCAAVRATSPDLKDDEIKRIKGTDAMRAIELAGNFFKGSGSSEQGISAELPDAMPEFTTHP